MVLAMVDTYIADGSRSISCTTLQASMLCGEESYRSVLHVLQIRFLYENYVGLPEANETAIFRLYRSGQFA